MLEAIARTCPAFRASAPPRNGRKSILVRGEVDGTPALAKLVREPRDDRAWTYYLANEIAILRAFASEAPPLRVPRVIAFSDDVLIREWISSPPFAQIRRPEASLGDSLPSLLSAIDGLAGYHVSVAAPTSRQRRHMRESLLEDPADPSWCAAALRSAELADIVPAGTVARLEPCLASLPAQFAHGDLLLRNVLSDGSVVDWECAGHHPAGWDQALLATQLVATERQVVEQRLSAAQHALLVVALAREVWFRARHDDASELRRELAHVLKLTI